MESMSKRDRSILGGLVLAMVVGVGGSLALAASCLGRDGAHRADDTSAFPEDRSARTSSGGVPGEEAVGETHITAAELPAGAPTAPPAPENAPPPNPNPTPAPPVTVRPPAAPQANTTVNVNVDGQRVSSTSTGDAAGAPAPAPAPATDQTSGGDAGASQTPPAAGTGTNGANAADGGPTRVILAPQPIQLPPPRFKTDSPPFGASSYESPENAGAGKFTTERNVPNVPGP
jgi:hypothetical protein